jgi:transcriptional regulatory protein RtcR
LDEQAMLLKAIEDKSFMPLGADKPVSCTFQLIAGTNHDLREDVARGQFRADLLARINVWVYRLPSLANRREDIAPNMDHLLQQMTPELGRQVRFNVEARHAYLAFALSPQAVWKGNFRDLVSSVTRLSTLATGGRISLANVTHEIERLQWDWGVTGKPAAASAANLADHLAREVLDTLDQFDALQLQAVIGVCKRHASLSEAGRELFDVSRLARSITNDADRLRKYLAKYGLSWDALNRE